MAGSRGLLGLGLLLAVSMGRRVSAIPSEREMTVEVGAGKEECFFEAVRKNEIIDVDYQVVEGGANNELSIDFR